jgi:predicted amidophosphoribosyltransferase
MTTCSCGFTLQPNQKFCPSCGAKVASAETPTLYPQYQSATGDPAASSPTQPASVENPTTYTQYQSQAVPTDPAAAGLSRCPHCGGDVNGNAPFCMHCGTPLAAATQQAAPASAPTSCPHCGSPVNPGTPFCSMCGAHVTGQAAAAPAVTACPGCGQATNGNAPFCMHCGARIQGAGAPAAAPGMQRPTTCTQCGYPMQAGAAFCTHCGAHYGPPVQPGMQPGMQPMMGMPQQVMRCPTCMGAVPAGTAFCTHCGTSLAGVPTPAGVQGQPGGFFQNLMGSNAGKIGLGVAGGLAAAVIGEELIHGLEDDLDGGYGGGYGYRRRRRRGLMGEIIEDIL